MYPTINDLLADLLGINIPIPFPIYSFGFFLIFGFSVGAYLTSIEVKRKEVEGLLQPTKKMTPKGEKFINSHDHMSNLVLIGIILGIIGAKLFHILENINEFTDDPWGSVFSSGGLSAYGGVILATIGIYYYAKKNNMRLLPLFDSAAPFLMLGYGIGRIGCQLSGDGDWGLPNDLPKPEWLSFLPDWMWAYDYPNNVIHVNLKQEFLKMGLESITGKAWPTPFYETIICTLLFVILWSIRKRISVPGMMFCIYLILNGVERFFIEKIRINNKYHFLGIEATQAEIISSLLIIIGIAGFIYLTKNKEKIINYYKKEPAST
jgi:prolipoprotein diacylglyceryl transferase